MEKPEGKRPLARPRHRREYYFKMEVKNTGKGRGLILFSSEYGQGADYCEHGNETSGSIQRGELLN